MGEPSGEPEYSIAAVSKLTGVSCHSLRVWERRYRFPTPQRSASGHRRYSADEVGVLRHLAKLVGTGRPIGELIDEHKAGRLTRQGGSAPEAKEKAQSAMIVDLLLTGEISGANAIIARLAERATPVELVQRVIEPALIDVGERWFRKECDIFQEHFAVANLFDRLGALLDGARRANTQPRRKILIGAVEGDRHEGGVLMVSLALELAGWRALPMGVDLPVGEYRKAVEAWRPDAVGLSFVLSRNINKRFKELSEIRGVPILVGGRSIVNHQGLARRHGLIPLLAPLSVVPAQIIKEVEAWERGRAGRRPAGP